MSTICQIFSHLILTPVPYIGTIINPILKRRKLKQEEVRGPRLTWLVCQSEFQQKTIVTFVVCLFVFYTGINGWHVGSNKGYCTKPGLLVSKLTQSLPQASPVLPSGRVYQDPRRGGRGERERERGSGWDHPREEQKPDVKGHRKLQVTSQKEGKGINPLLLEPQPGQVYLGPKPQYHAWIPIEAASLGREQRGEKSRRPSEATKEVQGIVGDNVGICTQACDDEAYAMLMGWQARREVSFSI